MPFRVAMPKTVRNPTSEATERTPPERKTPEDAADQGERQVHHDEEGIPHRAEDDVQEEPDAQDHGDAEEGQEPGRLLGALELAAVLDVVALILAPAERHRAGHPLADVPDDAPHVAARDVAHDDDLPLHVLPRDLVRARAPLDAGQGLQAAASRPPGVSTERFAIASAFRLLRVPDPHHQVEGVPPFEDLGDGLPAKGGLDRPCDVADGQAVPGDGRPVEVDLEDGDVGLLLDREVDDARDAAPRPAGPAPRASGACRGRRRRS